MFPFGFPFRFAAAVGWDRARSGPFTVLRQGFEGGMGRLRSVLVGTRLLIRVSFVATDAHRTRDVLARLWPREDESSGGAHVDVHLEAT